MASSPSAGSLIFEILKDCNNSLFILLQWVLVYPILKARYVQLYRVTCQKSELWWGFTATYTMKPLRASRAGKIQDEICIRAHSEKQSYICHFHLLGISLFSFSLQEKQVLTASWSWLIKCILLKSSFYKNAVMVKEQRRLLKSRLKQPKWTKALKCCKTYQTLFQGNGSVVQIRLCWCKYKNSAHCLPKNITLAEQKISMLLILAHHKHLRSVQDHRAVFSESHIKTPNTQSVPWMVSAPLAD